MRGHTFTLVIGIDFSDYAESVLQHGLDQALRHDEPTVRVVTVIADPRIEAATRQRLISMIERTLDDTVPTSKREHLTVIAHVRTGRPEEEIVELAEECLATLIVVGRFGAGHRRHGSVADLIVAGASCPVLVVPAPRDTSASDAQCTDCVQIRQDSGGDAWFCERHHGEHLGHSIAIIGSAVSATSRSW